MRCQRLVTLYAPLPSGDLSLNSVPCRIYVGPFPPPLPFQGPSVLIDAGSFSPSRLSQYICTLTTLAISSHRTLCIAQPVAPTQEGHRCLQGKDTLAAACERLLESEICRMEAAVVAVSDVPLSSSQTVAEALSTAAPDCQLAQLTLFCSPATPRAAGAV